MIAVLIPVFNTDVRALVFTLQKQLQQSGVPFEILVRDDASSSYFQDINKSLVGLPHFTFSQNIQNKGRLQTRIDLADAAQYPWLLFIDADCTIPNDAYIQEYLQWLEQNNDVLIGGTEYLPSAPEDCQHRLHWLYAMKRVGSYTSREKRTPYSGFLFNNVLIRKRVFKKLLFPDFLYGYGHEDTWVGMELEKQQVKIRFLKNPVVHPYLDESSIFLTKNLEALHNLKEISGKVDNKTLQRHVKLFHYYLLLRRTGLLFPLNWFIQTFSTRIKQNLLGCKPTLVLFDLYRLSYLSKLLRS